MTTRRKHVEKDCFYFVTFTCYKWLNLIDESKLYNYLPNWSGNLSKKSCLITGYVVMPNHLHLLVFIKKASKGLNVVIGEAKRFMSYEMVKRLRKEERFDTLKLLESAVTKRDKERGQQHVIFKSSFDAKEIRGEEAICKVLDYMHYNPVSGKWDLVKNYLDYKYSSARYYEFGEDSYLRKMDYREVLRVFCE